MSWRLVYTPQAQRDAKILLRRGFQAKVQRLLDALRINPYAPDADGTKLSGSLAGTYSQRISIHGRLVYEVLPHEHTVKIIRMGCWPTPESE